MPPSQKEIPLKRNDMTTIPDPDISDNNLSTGSKTPKLRDVNCSFASELSFKQARGSSKATFMTLPIEIRLQIYLILFVTYYEESGGYRIRWAGRPKFFEYGVTRMHLGILRTCRQIYEEANSIFYTENNFYFRDARNLLQFVNDIGHANLKLVKKVSFRNDTSSLWQLLDKLVDGQNVSENRKVVHVMKQLKYTAIEYPGGACGPTTEQNFALALKNVRAMSGKLNQKNLHIGMINFSGRTFRLVFGE
jgi:hypothetical protein